jgi:RNA polymerase sigma-70 factor (ECF subfamily)
MDTTPVSLLKRVQHQGRPEDWNRLVDLCSPLLYGWARRKGLPEPDAADLVQDVFALLLHKLPEFHYDPSRTFRGWLKQVALNKLYETQRRRRPPRPVPQAILEGASPGDEPDPFWELDYRQELVRRALEIMQSQFQPRTWQACWEHVVSGRSAAEVAADLGMSPGAVYVAKSRVLRRLRQELEGLLD